VYGVARVDRRWRKVTVSVPQSHEKPYAKRILFDTFGADTERYQNHGLQAETEPNVAGLAKLIPFGTI
jgi:hypothetical protein